MKTATWLRALAVTVAGLIAPAAWGADIAFDYVHCGNEKYTQLDTPTSSVRAVGVEGWKIVASSTTKDFENATLHCLGYWRDVEGKVASRGVCKGTDPAGNTWIGEWELTAPGEGTFVFLNGTGKFKGIGGGGRWKTVARGKPITEGTGQLCTRDSGTYTLP
jgi:hypothetical protein